MRASLACHQKQIRILDPLPRRMIASPEFLKRHKRNICSKRGWTLDNKVAHSVVSHEKIFNMEGPTNMFETLFTETFSHIGIEILEFLDRKSFNSCKIVCKNWLTFIENQRKFLKKDIELAKKNQGKNVISFWNKIEKADQSIDHLQELCKFIRQTMSEIKWNPCKEFANHRTNYDFNKNFHDLKYLFIYGNQARLEFSLPYLEISDLVHSNIGGNTPFEIAARTGNLQFYKLLQDNLPHYKACKYLIKASLTAAASSGSLEMFRHILQDCSQEMFKRILQDSCKLNPRPKDLQHTTVLHQACKGNSVEIVELILQNLNPKLNVNPFDKSKTTPLHLAAENGNLKIFQMIAERLKVIEYQHYDADDCINPRNALGFTPLHLAASSNNFQLFEYIFNLVEDENPISRRRVTIAHCAAQSGNVTVLKFLNQHGFDLFYEDLFLQKPQDYASKNEQWKAVKYLESVKSKKRPREHVLIDSNSKRLKRKG